MQEGKLISTKQLKIDKANTTILVVLSVCSFIFVFSLIASKTLISQYTYQNKVTSAQQTTVNRLKANQLAATKLINSYNALDAMPTNIIGGSSTTITSNQDGTNSKIILDALPIIYDYPSLLASLPNLLTNVPGLTVTNISVNTTSSGGSTTSSSAAATAPVATTLSNSSTPIPVSIGFNISGSLATDNAALNNLQASIRPIQITTIDISGSDGNATMSIDAQTFYLPSVGFTTSKETIK